MQIWKTTIRLNHEKGTLTLPNVKINKCIFQGDSRFPIIFCLALDPLSKIINETRSRNCLNKKRRRTSEKTVNHLFFMDSLKLYTELDRKLEESLRMVHNFLRKIKMDFGFDKCAKCTIKTGKKVRSNNIQLDKDIVINEIGGQSTLE